ncbi:MAG: molybdopterin biosynthesis protein [Desulfovibrio sp.]|jgi:putative molybdopterin biosynthesis protein|nr:molybdopterin biosynthesis protein [Desulfovibrio sp.]
MQRSVYLKLVSPSKALRILLDAFAASPLKPESIPLSQAHGRVLAEAATARLSSPAFHGAAMDGVAVAAEETFGATERRPKVLRLGENAHRINTGHILPRGCNAVIMVEHLVPGKDDFGHETVTVEKAAFPWQHVRKLGEDIVATEIVLPPGVLIGPYQLGALAAAGITRPKVFKKPKVAIIPSGSELIPLEEATEEILGQGEKLPEFNSLTLAAMVREAGGEPVIHPIVPDREEELRQALLEAVESDADLVVINAGSSAGSEDYTAGVIADLGDLLVHGISMMPGKPTAFGGVKGKPVLGVPGYPVSAILTFEEIGQPLLAAWTGRSMPEPAVAQALFPQDIPSRPGMEEFIRVKLGLVNGDFVAVPLPRGAGTVSSLSRAEGILRLPADSEGLSAGSRSPVRLIKSARDIAGSLLAIGSHDNTLDILDSLLRKLHPGRSFTSSNVGSLGGLMALREGRCHLAGSHLLSEDGEYNKDAVRRHLSGFPVQLMRLVDREQGFIVPPGNPRSVTSLRDLTQTGLRFINRQRGSGTRVLLDFHLKRLGLSPEAVAGYEDEEYTHMQIAAAVLSGRADVGLGVKSAAVALKLDFVPFAVEEYDLVIPTRYWKDERIQDLAALARSDIFKEIVTGMGGYSVDKSGELVWTFPG